MELIRIQNFAGITEMEFEFRPITVLIGPQASGKSVAIKLLYFFRKYINDIVQSVVSGETEDQFLSRQNIRFRNFFYSSPSASDTFRISYTCEQLSITITPLGYILGVETSDALSNAFNELRDFYTNEEMKLAAAQTNIFAAEGDQMKKKVRDLFREKFTSVIRHNQCFIPAGRSFFAQFNKHMFSYLNNNGSIDPFLVEFGSLYEEAKDYLEKIKKVVDGALQSKAIGKESNVPIFDSRSPVLESTYDRDVWGEYLVHSDGRRVNVANASSGQQETLPLLMMLDVLKDSFDGGEGITLYVEEPEAHIFPVAQKQIVHLMAKFFNAKRSKCQIIITTHSPYILSSFNNLLQAGQLSATQPEKADLVANVIPKDEQIHPDSFIAYSLANGQAENIMDAETQLISATVLDSISNEIAIEFGKLLDIEF